MTRCEAPYRPSVLAERRLGAGLFLPFGLKGVHALKPRPDSERAFQFLGHILQHLDVGRNTLRLDRASGRGKVARGGQPQRAIAGAEWNNGLHGALAERARADKVARR